jgi:hypothetical protein
MRTALLRSSAALVGLATLVGAGCGDDDDGGEQAYVDAWAATLTSGDGFSVAEDEASCMSVAMMDELGTEPFEEAGVEPADIDDASDSPGELLGAGKISEEQADAILDEWEKCADLPASLAEAAVGELDLDEAGRSCVADGLREDDLAREGLKPSFTSDNDTPPAAVLRAVVDLLEACGADGASDGGSGGVLVDGIAEQLAANADLTEEQARCVAQSMLDTIGVERLIELGAGDGGFDAADPEVQQEIAGAVLQAAETCDIPP